TQRRVRWLPIAAMGLVAWAGTSGCVRKVGSEPAALPTMTEDLPARVPFGKHGQKYVEGSILPSASQEELNRATRSFYDFWKKKYLKLGCEEGELVVEAKTKPTNLTVSEAHGYGMIIL